MEHPFKKQNQWFLKYIIDSVTSFFLSFSIYLDQGRFPSSLENKEKNHGSPGKG